MSHRHHAARMRPQLARLVQLFALACLFGALVPGRSVRAIGEAGAVDIRVVTYADGRTAARPSAARRLSWALRQRTSVETRLEPGTARLDDPSVFETPLLYWSGEAAFPPLSKIEMQGLRRFVEFGGAVIIDDASGDEHSGFAASIERTLARAFGKDALHRLPEDHTLYRSFYLIDRPVGRVEGPGHLQAVERGGRAAVIFSRHDLGGAWARDNLGNYLFPVVPGGSQQREMAFRLGVNIVMYALCLDYKDDQVHSPFIMRRRAGQP